MIKEAAVYKLSHIYIDTYSYVCNGIIFNHKKELNFAICSDMDGLEGHYAKWNQSNRERQILYDITRGIYKIQQTDE